MTDRDLSCDEHDNLTRIMVDAVGMLRVANALKPAKTFQVEDSWVANDHRYVVAIRAEPTFSGCLKVTLTFECKTEGVVRVPFAENPKFRRRLGKMLATAMTVPVPPLAIPHEGQPRWEVDPGRTVGEDEIGCCVIAAS